jgi:hypothetical protein
MSDKYDKYDELESKCNEVLDSHQCRLSYELAEKILANIGAMRAKDAEIARLKALLREAKDAMEYSLSQGPNWHAMQHMSATIDKINAALKEAK